MKILHVITLADLGGAQSVLINICDASIRDGNEVFVASEENGLMWELLNPKVKQIKIKPLHRNISLVNDFKVLFQLRAINNSVMPDVVHLHSSKIGILGRLVFPKTKIIYTVHGFDSIRIAHRKFLFFEKLLKNRAKNIVAVSKYDLNNLHNEGIIKNTNLIYNGIKDCLTEEDSLPNHILTKLEDYYKTHKVIMTIARLSPPKDFELFCKIAEIFRDNKNFKFIWIGNKENVDVIDNVILLGEIPNAFQCFKYCHISLLPSKFEGLPISIIESLSMGKPVVASKVGGIPEILDNTNGYALENNFELFVQAIKTILDDNQSHVKFGLNARNTFVSAFTIDKMYKKYVDLYKNIELYNLNNK